ncbi:hypothetical protein AGABI2DRAFT_193084 [Agaricus bisporus var. bisporus H97]|uniref:hypothetical protein n=1 Tax=Agaricus bisporus var. bisporus (strain H97 / ATCC MYA-4626 / FGSC 10389) TaxID=936046 RepID=UPI00029F532B|nr:hypothetical protein AGABI2DRAFT_193084 [Agaricus bisporus var. bisporus H97]EKV46361.1 hypothetical protein AGABI2DRAFT_193084 [Agaricus bisporus var. bisporus H97]
MRRHGRLSAQIGVDCQPLGRCSSEDHSDDESEAESLELDIFRIDHVMKQLQQGKLHRLRRLNALRSTTRNLPPEILLLIFHHVATPITKSTFLDHYRCLRYRKHMERNISIIRCASVSSLWRNLILSTPPLWTTLVLNILPNAGRSEKELLELSWMRSQQLPIAVDLEFVGSRDSGGLTWEAKAREFFAHVRSMEDRLSMLRLHNPPRSLVRHISKSPLRQLQCLSLESMNTAAHLNTTFTLSSLPHLRQLTLRSIWCRILISQNNISVLDFFDTSLDVCIGIFTHCPNLVEVHCRFPRASRGVHDIHLDSTIIFPFLKNLTWTLSCHSINVSFIQQLKLPALETLQLYGDADHRDSIRPQHIIQFFHRLSPGLRELELVNWKEWTCGDLAQIFHDVRNTRKLVLRDCFETFTLDMVKLLSLVQIGSAHKLEYLPHLALLSIQSIKAQAHLGILPDLMKRRALSSIGMQHFELEISRPAVSVIQLLEAEAAVKNGSIKLKFLEKFAV